MSRRVYHVGQAAWEVVLEHVRKATDGREAGWYGWCGRVGSDPEHLIGPHDCEEDVWCEFEARKPSAKRYKDLVVVAERRRIRALREECGMSRSELERLCGFTRGVVRRFEECPDKVEMLLDRRHMMTMLRVLHQRLLVNAATSMSRAS